MERETLTSSGPNPISLVIVAFALGVFFSSFVSIAPLVSLLFIAVALLILLAEKIHYRRVGRHVFLLSLTLIALSVGSLRYAVKDFHDVRKPALAGIVASEPEDRENGRRFVFQADNGEKALVSVPLYTPLAYGDRLEVNAHYTRPGVIQNENTGSSFDYAAYLSREDIYWTTNFAQIHLLAHGKGSAIEAALLKLKANFIAHIDRILPEPEAGLLAGLLVAGKGSVPAAIIEEFRRAGVVHIVVLSGFNVTLIAEFLRTIFRRFFVWAKFSRLPHGPDAAALLGIALFVLMTGAEATVVRAALMASVAIAARLFGRNFSALRALYFVAFLMLLSNPKLLVFDPSFQLSFLATLGLILFAAPLKRRLAWVSERFQLREIVSQTIATQATVLPLLVYSTGSLSLVSLPANLLILPLVPSTMLVGFIATLLSYAHWLLAWPFSLLSHLLLSWILLATHLFASLPFATISISL